MIQEIYNIFPSFSVMCGHARPLILPCILVPLSISSTPCNLV